MVAVLISCLCLLGFVLIRILPIWKGRFRGCDAYYFLQVSEAFRSKKRLPIVLPPVYLLELDEQWYPPGFAVILGLLPKKVIERYFWLFTNSFDLVIGIAIFWFFSTEYGIWAASAGILLYAFSPFVVLEYSNLTSRAVAVLFFVGYMISSYLFTQGDMMAGAIALLCGIILLFTHKLTIQLLWFLSPFMSLVMQDVSWLGLLAASYGGALVLGRKQFINILRAHKDIVMFWNKHWKFLGCHQVNDSPIYGSEEDTASFHGAGGLKTLIKHCQRIFQYNPLILMLVFVPLDATGLYWFLASWIVGTYIWASLTLIVPFFRCVGEGTKYIKYAIAPSCVLSVMILFEHGSTLSYSVFAVCLVLNAVFYRIIWKSFHGDVSAAGVEDTDMRAALDQIKTMQDARILCMPVHMSDLVAYQTNQPVMWGTHGYGFENVGDFFPVFRKPIPDFVEKHKLTHMLLDDRYVKLEALKLENVTVLQTFGSYSIVEFS